MGCDTVWFGTSMKLHVITSSMTVIIIFMDY